jgi:hypothetical protein
MLRGIQVLFARSLSQLEKATAERRLTLSEEQIKHLEVFGPESRPSHLGAVTPVRWLPRHLLCRRP